MYRIYRFGCRFQLGRGGILYTASEHAVVGLVRQLANELAPDVRVNGVSPGATQTDIRGLASLGQEDVTRLNDPSYGEMLRSFNPLGIALRPEDHAGAYVFLASRIQARGITGAILASDGGETLRWTRPN